MNRDSIQIGRVKQKKHRHLYTLETENFVLEKEKKKRRKKNFK